MCCLWRDLEEPAPPLGARAVGPGVENCCPSPAQGPQVYAASLGPLWPGSQAHRGPSQTFIPSNHWVILLPGASLGRSDLTRPELASTWPQTCSLTVLLIQEWHPRPISVPHCHIECTPNLSEACCFLLPPPTLPWISSPPLSCILANTPRVGTQRQSYPGSLWQ